MMGKEKFLRMFVFVGVLVFLFGSAGFGEEKAKCKCCAGSGIASRYVRDAGIAIDGDVIFADDFESWEGDGTKNPKGKWDGVRVNDSGITWAIAGKVTVDGWDGGGKKILEIANWHTGGDGSSGVNVRLGNYNSANDGLGDGYEEVYVRYYLKFYDDYKVVRNHGANLGGRDVTREGSRWVGQANTPDVAAMGYFFSGLQPSGERGSQDIHMRFYSYHMDKKGQWGAGYEILKKIAIKPGRWYCVERRMKMNSTDPLKADGIEELWIDGVLSIRKEGLRFRKVPELRISYFSLENYYHGLGEEYTKEKPVRVYFDNVVIARKYIGPMAAAVKVGESSCK